MSDIRHGAPPAAIVALLLLTAACSPGQTLDGKYYNSRSGEFAMELRRGKVVTMQGQEGRTMSFEVRGDSLVIHDPGRGMADGMTFGIEPDGSLSLGVLGSLKKR